MSAYDAEQIRNIKCHIEMMVESELQEEIGLPGREPHMQVLRICNALNDTIAERDQLRARVAMLRGALKIVTDSATPRLPDHPAMFSAWQVAAHAIKSTEPSAGGEG